MRQFGRFGAETFGHRVTATGLCGRIALPTACITLGRSKMSQFIRLALKTIAIACLPLTVALSSYAQSGDRTEQLEKEIQEIKLRLSNLEAAQGKSSANPRPVQTVMAGRR